MTLDEISDYIGALHGETKPQGEFWWAKMSSWAMLDGGANEHQMAELRNERDAALLKLAIKALRNQGQPYYGARQP